MTHVVLIRDKALSAVRIHLQLGLATVRLKACFVRRLLRPLRSACALPPTSNTNDEHMIIIHLDSFLLTVFALSPILPLPCYHVSE